jgi:hypothetical protein
MLATVDSKNIAFDNSTRHGAKPLRLEHAAHDVLGEFLALLARSVCCDAIIKWWCVH